METPGKLNSCMQGKEKMTSVDLAQQLASYARHLGCKHSGYADNY